MPAESVMIEGRGPDGQRRIIEVTADGELYVAMTGADIEIGAVEIKDADSDLRAQVTAQGLQVAEAAIACAAADINVPAVNTAAVVTYAAVAGLRHHITGVAWSYAGGIPVGGRLTVTDAGAVVFDIDIAEEGAGLLMFPKPKMNALVNTAMVVTLAAGGAAIFGKVNVLNHYTE